MEHTLFIIKPDGVANKVTGKILTIIEESGFKIVAQKMMLMTGEIVSRFYKEHKDKSFFPAFTTYMTSGPVVICVLQRDGAVSKLREILGDTNPEKAKEGTIRKLYGKNIESNVAHGSDSANSAAREVSFFFAEYEINF